MNAAAKAEKLAGFECAPAPPAYTAAPTPPPPQIPRLTTTHRYAKRVLIDYEAWTADNGMLTPTFKLKRNDVRKKYAARPLATHPGPWTSPLDIAPWTSPLGSAD